MAHFDLKIRVLVYSHDSFRRIAESIPDNWTNDQDMKSDVWFLWPEADDEAVLEELTIKPEIDRVNYVSGAVLWSVDKEYVTKSGMQQVIGTKLYKLMTIRNVNTVRKLIGLMEEVEAEEQ